MLNSQLSTVDSQRSLHVTVRRCASAFWVRITCGATPRPRSACTSCVRSLPSRASAPRPAPPHSRPPPRPRRRPTRASPRGKGRRMSPSTPPRSLPPCRPARPSPPTDHEAGSTTVTQRHEANKRRQHRTSERHHHDGPPPRGPRDKVTIL